MSLNVVVCGMIRSHLEAALIFADLAKAKISGSVGRIVYCTWRDHLASLGPGYLSAMGDFGIEVMGVERPDTGDSFLLQVLPFYKALSCFASEDLVARVRTDKCYPLVRRLCSLAPGVAGLITKIDSPIFDHKVIIQSISVNELFAHVDFFMMGHAADLRKLCHLDQYYDLFCFDVGGETKWFAHPFVRHYPIFRSVFETVSIRNLGLALFRWANKVGREPLPPSLAIVIAAYLQVCSRDFGLIDPLVPAPSADVVELLSAHASGAHRWGDRVFVDSQAWLDRCLVGPHRGDLGEASSRLKQVDLDRFALSDGELDAIRDFVASHVEHSPSKTSGLRASTATALGGSGEAFRTILGAGVESVDELFDWSKVTTEMSSLIESTSQFDETVEDFPSLCRRVGLALADRIQVTYGDHPPGSLLSLPAVYFVSSLAFCWDGASGEWLADKLLSSQLSMSFGEVTRWGLTARWYNQSPAIIYKAALLLQTDIGGAELVGESKKLMSAASERGDPRAQAFRFP